jgi:hypothetical protein
VHGFQTETKGTSHEQDNHPPSHRVYAVTKNGERSFWQPIGAAWVHSDGWGFNVNLDYPLASTGQHGFDTALWPNGVVKWGQWFGYVASSNGSEIFDRYGQMLRNVSDDFAWGVVLGLTAAPLCDCGISLIKGKEFGLVRDLSGVFGAARWANAAELDQMKSGLELGTDKLTGRAIRVSIEGNLLTIAAPRKGKSAGLLIPNLVCPELEAWAGPAVVIDPKGAVFLSVAKRRRERAEPSGVSILSISSTEPIAGIHSNTSILRIFYIYS